MRKFNITVNGNTYEVDVEEIKDGVPVMTSSPVVSAPQAAPAQTQVPMQPAEKPKAAASSGSAGSVKIEAPMPGTIVKISVKPGDSVKSGQVLVVLEAMKMENEIVSPSDAVVASVNVSSGDGVSSGDILVTLN